MPEFDERIDQLQARLENLVKTQEYFRGEISQIRYELNVLRAAGQKQGVLPPPPAPQEGFRKPPVREYVPPPRSAPRMSQEGPTTESQPPPPNGPAPPQPHRQEPQYSTRPGPQPSTPPAFGNAPGARSGSEQTHAATAAQEPKTRSDIERFIGENLISKIGIVITVLGVAIGAKYAIDNNLISPLARIVLGYLFGFALLGFAVHLKEKYLNFSAVLLSGAMAIQYFITFAAYSFYQLMSQSSAFALMLIFTVFTILAAIKYNRQIIAHFGLVGAYTIPFLLSDGSGNYPFLFGYIAIINVGILAISVVKYWKPLYFSSFIVTWATFYGWYVSAFKPDLHFPLALGSLTVFFLIFYLTFLAYKALKKEPFTREIVFLVLANSFIFYGLGYAVIDSRADAVQFLGLFTVANALLHFIVGFLIARFGLADRNSVHLLTALVLTFVTIAVPVQFRGNWLTVLWAAEGLILFWIGRTKGVSLYEYFSYPLMALSALSLWNDWQRASPRLLSGEIDPNPLPFLNSDFLTAVFFIGAFTLIFFISRSKKYEPAVALDLVKIADYVIPSILLLALYNTFRLEIDNYWQFRLMNSSLPSPADPRFPVYNRDLDLFNIVWQINYTLLFVTVLSIANLKKIKSRDLGLTNLILNTIALVIFLVGGLLVLGELREGFLHAEEGSPFPPGLSSILTRYASLALVGALIFVSYQFIRLDFFRETLPNLRLAAAFDFVLYFSLWVILSSELINWMDISGYDDSYKLGLSILWGVYALLLVALGISRHKKRLRIGAFALFGVTLAKVFLYDLSHLSTIAKTVVCVSLGVLLLVISFLYNKYKHLIIEAGEV